MSDENYKNAFYYPGATRDACDLFFDWSRLVDREVCSVDGRKVCVARKLIADYMLVKEVISLHNFIIPRSLAESLDKKDECD